MYTADQSSSWITEWLIGQIPAQSSSVAASGLPYKVHMTELSIQCVPSFRPISFLGYLWLIPHCHPMLKPKQLLSVLWGLDSYFPPSTCPFHAIASTSDTPPSTPQAMSLQIFKLKWHSFYNVISSFLPNHHPITSLPSPKFVPIFLFIIICLFIRCYLWNFSPQWSCLRTLP